VTIGILSCNARRYLDRTIPAILSWIHPNHELLVVDNGSTDGTVEQLRGLLGVRIAFNGENAGYGHGKNMLASLARAEYVLLLDDDILIPTADVVSECLAFCVRHPETAFVSVPLVEPGSERTPHYGLFFTEPKKSVTLEQLRSRRYFQVGGATGGLIFCRKSVFQQLGGYDTIYSCHIDDFDLSARAYLQGWQIYTLTGVHAVHLGTERRLDTNRWAARNDYHLCGFLRMILKNYTLPGALFWAPVASVWILWKTVSKYRETRNRRVLTSYVTSVSYFFRDLRDTLQRRIAIQTNRVVREDIFRRVSSPWR
jgi:GT2 family glycosyltransferase